MKKVFGILLLMIILNSCAVVRTPYFKTSYYRNTVERLDNEKDSVKITGDSLKAGYAKISITPGESMLSGKSGKKGVPIAGFGQMKTKYVTGVHDSIFVRAVALKTGNDLSVIVSADMLLMPPDVIDIVVQNLSVAGISRDQLFFSATHSHSSIGGWGHGPLAKIIAGKKDPEIRQWLAEKIETAVIHASSALEPASLNTGSFSAPQFTVNRLTHLPDKLNTDLNYVILKLSDGTRAIIGSYSAHATTIGSSNTLLSGDYPGYWEKNLEASGYKVAMFCGGSMANQSPYGNGKIFESAEYIGRSLADSLINKPHYFHGNVEKGSVSLKIELPKYRMRMSKNCTLPTWMSSMLMPAPANVYLQALRINNLVWFFTPGDFSGESALLMKKILKGQGFETVISGYNGSYIGYILPEKYFYLKHYETRTMSWFGPTIGDYLMDLMEKMSNFLTH